MKLALAEESVHSTQEGEEFGLELKFKTKATLEMFCTFILTPA